MPAYHLYVRDKTQYEVVEHGWSTLAFFLGPWSGIATIRGFTLIFGPMCVLALGIEAFDRPSPLLVAVGIIGVLVGGLYYIANANRWRIMDLEARGYEWVATIESTSAKSALREWALSPEATEYFHPDT